MSDTIEQAQPADITVSTPLVQSAISVPAISANHKQDRLKTISELTHQELVDALRRMKPDDTDEYVYKLSKSGQWRRYKKPSEEQQELNKQRLQKASQIRLQNQQAKKQSTIARQQHTKEQPTVEMQKDPQRDQLQTLIEDIKQLKEQYIKSNTQAVFTQQIIRSRSQSASQSASQIASQSILPEIQAQIAPAEPSRSLRNPNLLRFMK